MNPQLCATIDTYQLVPQLQAEAPGWAKYIIYLQSFAVAAKCPAAGVSLGATIFTGCGGGAYCPPHCSQGFNLCGGYILGSNRSKCPAGAMCRALTACSE